MSTTTHVLWRNKKNTDTLAEKIVPYLEESLNS